MNKFNIIVRKDGQTHRSHVWAQNECDAYEKLVTHGFQVIRIRSDDGR